MRSKVSPGNSVHGAARGGPCQILRLLEGYRVCARSEGKSDATIAGVSGAVSRMTTYLGKNRLPTDVTSIGAEAVRGFILDLQEASCWSGSPFPRKVKRGLSPTTVNDYCRALSAFFSWLVAEEVITASPFARVRIPKPRHTVIATFTERQIAAMLDAAARNERDGRRDFAMLLMLLDTGIRRSELTGLARQDVDLASGVIKVRGKGDKERHVPLGARAAKALWRYFEEPSPPAGVSEESPVFHLKEGGPLTGNRVHMVISKYGRMAGVEEVRCSAHTFRHTFAITYLRNGGDVFSLQRILGHSSLDVCRHYINLAQSDIKEAHRRFSPADRLNYHGRRESGRGWGDRPAG